MIINTGSRTDIPAYFSDWFYNRIREKKVLTRNPYYPQQVISYALNPDVVDVLVFCTKNPKPMLARLDELNDFRQYWHVTITPYGKDIEPFVPDKEKVMASLKELSKKIGIKHVGWRYDPIFLNDKYTIEFHIAAFDRMASVLDGYVDNCVVSFIDLYEKTKRNFRDVREVSKEDQERLIREFVSMGKAHGITIKTCCENESLGELGADITGCLTQKVLEDAIGGSLNVPAGKGMTREGCNCLLGNDIGMYNSCGHGCLYCYANYNRTSVVNNMKQHDPNSPLLVGHIQEGDKITASKQVSYYWGQMKLF